jgi:hypothetical protein
MDFQTFKRILLTFADRPTDLDASRGQLIAEIRGETIHASIQMRGGAVWVTENGRADSAETWLTQRIARLPQLAERLLSIVPQERHFVPPCARLLDQLEVAPTESEELVLDAADGMKQFLDRKPAGTTSVLYLTSDAGEGKTTLINEVTRRTAQRYKEKLSDYLVVPIPLGGRTFLRLDDVVIGALMNRLRFPYLYFESFIEMLRIGVIVPALDGFEEMFIESAPGEAVSALGILVQDLRSAGTVLVAARKAYFEYRSFETQSRLYDTLGKESASFARMDLLRWDRTHFLRYAEARGLHDPSHLYEQVSARLGVDHALLTRAVLVRRLVDLSDSTERTAKFIESLGDKSEGFFTQFVQTILEREAHEKWIDKQGEAHNPLLSVEQHIELLSMVAQEMWENNVDALRPEVMDVIAELFCEGNKLPVGVSRQVTERLKQHALIVKDGQRQVFAFDHEEFRNYFLGCAVGRIVRSGLVTEQRRLLRVADLPRLTLDVAAFHLASSVNSKIVDSIQQAANAEGPASFTRENAGGLVLRLLGSAGVKDVRDLSFPVDSFSGRALTGVTFTGCYFRPTSLAHTDLRDCLFDKCEFEGLEFDDGHQVVRTQLRNCKIHRVTVKDKEINAFDPTRVAALLATNGFLLHEPAEPAAPLLEIEVDEELAVALRFMRLLLRATQVNEQSIRSRLGKSFGLFERSVLPLFLQRGVLDEVQYYGSGVQRRFKLRVRMHRVEEAERAAAGSFARFLDTLVADQ